MSKKDITAKQREYDVQHFIDEVEASIISINNNLMNATDIIQTKLEYLDKLVKKLQLESSSDEVKE